MKDMLLRVNLTNGNVKKESIPEAYLRDYIGGSGLAARYLYDEIPTGRDVFDESNKLCFSTGPLNGGSYPTSGRYNLSCRSPLTGIWLDTSSSGKFGYYLRRSGFMAIIIEGKSDKPVYLYVNNGNAEIRDATNLWGMTTSEAIALIKRECELNKSSVAVIGPTGEKLVKMACVISDEGRAAGRGGAGALMGSKKLKGVLVAGDVEIDSFEKQEWKETVKQTTRNIAENPTVGVLRQFGTAVGMAAAPKTGDAPTKNWQYGTWDKYMNISGPTMSNTILKKHSNNCHACPIQCSRYVEVKEGPYKMEGGGPEYETLGSFGSLCLNDNLESIAYINMLCNEYGIDTISAGSAIAFAMEAYEKGILTKEDLDGIDLKWGDMDAILSILIKILNKEGIGELLGGGVRHISSVLGENSEEFAVHVKGLELPMHDPRAFFGYGITYATSPRGACHCHGYIGGWDGQRGMPEAGLMEATNGHATKGKGELSKAVQDYCSVVSSSVICLFTTYEIGPTDLAKALKSATGNDYSAQDILKIGERVFNLQRAFNNRFGVTREDDVLPLRVMTPQIGGPNEGVVMNFSDQLIEYYEARGWETDGRPSKAKLKELGLDFVIKDLY